MAPSPTAITPAICRDVTFQVRRARVPSWLAEDARQEAFVRILAAAPRYQADRNVSFRHFCRLQEFGAARDFLRREFRATHLCGRDDDTAAPPVSLRLAEQTVAAAGSSPEQLAAATEIPALLRTLPPLWQFILIERYWSGRTFAEIAHDCGRHFSRVHQIHELALRRLYQYATQRLP